MEIQAEMAGIVQAVLVSEGQAVEAGQDVVVLESMKMQIPVASPAGGTVRAVRVKPGDFVNQGDVLLELDT
ncbi:biotin/lipoyl attachment domain-containing protein [Thermaerobacter marianensis DSM 12885]|uniref:Biotin/lipoyl attachment domain-containing protein n=1 Tax=Thermaerobacter marianensis (strain ATCC 700841 / DSM 12885 / JCM 10246 / 7p75a) TaxID=644966 RepID=E6SML2_THEM7|nr:acetyl-CoA carboxylase biotin carboxyl carrier protein subunit [Thermaerobacter marianensis]ADU51504.1 biotin/lipoyl attachment domain-containing protein [Thermaerobacter marianensis DSM 12885]